MNGERGKVHYVAVYQDGNRRLLRRVILDLPHGLIPPPVITLHEPGIGPHAFICAGDGTQAEIARMYGVAQQSVGRWIRYTEQADRGAA